MKEYRWTNNQKDIRTYRQTDRQTGGQAKDIKIISKYGRQADRWTYR